MALTREMLHINPFVQFENWYNVNLDTNPYLADAVTLATVNRNGRPSTRVVLLKEYNNDGYIFYTNYASRKGVDLSENPFACLNFYWPHDNRQVRIEGKVEKTSPETSDQYFMTRPFGSRIGAHASPQSQPIPDRDFLESKYNSLNEQHNESTLNRPENWGGYLLRPDRFEFWQAGENRLHDRFQYALKETFWDIKRLAP